MAYDALGMLIDGTIVLIDSTDTPAISLTRDAATGAAVIDLKKTGAKGLCAVLTLPFKPTTYADYLSPFIEESDILGEPTGIYQTWTRIASFPLIHAMTKELWATATTAFVASDVGKVVAATTDSASDAGVISKLAPELLAIGGYGKIEIVMSDANDDYSTAGDTLTSAGTGRATQGAAAQNVNGSGIPGIYVVRFTATKRYVRANVQTSAGGTFGLVSCLLTDEAAWPKYH